MSDISAKSPEVILQHFTAVDAALQPAGLLPDLSRITAEYAQPLPKWDAQWLDVRSGSLALDADALAVRVVDPKLGFSSLLTDLPIREFPSPAARTALDEKRPTALRVWSIHVGACPHGAVRRLSV